jgi:hypothetical protein
MPEIAVPFKSADFIAGRDPAYEAAIAGVNFTGVLLAQTEETNRRGLASCR